MLGKSAKLIVPRGLNAPLKLSDISLACSAYFCASDSLFAELVSLVLALVSEALAFVSLALALFAEVADS